MSPEVVLSGSDRVRSKEVLERLSERHNSRLSLSGLLDDWSRFVVSVQQGYGFSLDSYYRDLTVRDLIEEVSESLSMNGRMILSAAIRDTDENFIQVTVDPDNPHSTNRPEMEIGWWQFRIPKNPGKTISDEMSKSGDIIGQPDMARMENSGAGQLPAQ